MIECVKNMNLVRTRITSKSDELPLGSPEITKLHHFSKILLEKLCKIKSK